MVTTAATRRRTLPKPALATWQVHAITAVLGLLMTIGTYIDGWAHTHLISSLESFFTPWHGILYSGYAAAGVWIAIHRDRPGYALGFAGVIGFGAGGMFDMIWHTLFGIENDAEALVSPSHLVLFASSLLIVTTPLRAAWISDLPRRVGWRDFSGAAIAFVSLLGTFSFMFMYLSPFNDWLASDTFAGEFTATSSMRLAQKGGLASFLWSTFMYTTPFLALLTRWRPPAGFATLAMSLVAIGITWIDPLLLETPALALSGIAMGALIDMLLTTLDPSPHRTRAFRTFGAIAPLPLALVALIVTEARWGVAWPASLTVGIVGLTSGVGLLLAVLMTLPRREEGAVA